MIHFLCPCCRAGLRAGDDKVGRRTRCPKCRSRIEVPIAHGNGPPPETLDQSVPVSDSHDSEPAWEQQAGKNKTGLLLLSLFITGLVCGTLVFLVIFIKMKQAKPPSVARAEQSKTGPTAGKPFLPLLSPKQTDATSSAPRSSPEPESGQTPDKVVRQPKEEEYEAEQKRTTSPTPEALETPAPPKPRAQPLEDFSTEKSEELVAPFVHDLKHQKLVERRLEAIESLAQLGPKGKAASRVLCESLLDGSARVRLAAAEALAKVNPTLQRLVIPIMVDKELETRLECVRKIGQLGLEGKPAVPVVIHFKQQYQGGAFTVDVLAAIAPDDKTVTATIATWLTSDSDPYVRLAAVKALPHLEGAKDHVRAFMKVLRTDPMDAVRAAAVNALAELGLDAKDADKVLRLARTDSSAQVREAAERALEKIHQ